MIEYHGGLNKFRCIECNKRFSTNEVNLEKLKKDGFKIYAVEQNKNSVPYYRLKIKSHNLKTTAIIFGNEVRGIPGAILKKADKILEIPMRGRKESLNVAVAAGIVLFYLRQP